LKLLDESLQFDLEPETDVEGEEGAIEMVDESSGKESDLYICPSCGAFISSDTKVCPSCGLKFHGADDEDTEPSDEEMEPSGDMPLEEPMEFTMEPETSEEELPSFEIPEEEEPEKKPKAKKLKIKKKKKRKMKKLKTKKK
jgi:hypothetical protein